MFSGHLIELTDTDKLTKLQQYLLTKFTNKTFWVGASDLEEEGTFRWFYSGAELTRDLWSAGEPGRGEAEENCVQLDQSMVKFSDADCELERCVTRLLSNQTSQSTTGTTSASTRRRSTCPWTTTTCPRQRAGPAPSTPSTPTLTTARSAHDDSDNDNDDD